MSRIAAAFSVQPPVYLVKYTDNTAIFPHDSTGRFFASSLDSGATYDVYGSVPSSTTSIGSHPFGSYTRYETLNPPHPSTANFTKKRLIKKSIILGSISLREEGTSSSKNPIQYCPVTQITVALDPSRGQCSIEGVCAKIKEQVVILLYSKCYPLLKTEDSSSSDYWRSTRKVIAAPVKVYEKLGGVSADTDWSKHLEACDADAGSSAPPTKKPRNKGKERVSVGDKNVDPEGKMAIVISKLEGIERKISVFEELRKGFECCICKAAVKLQLCLHVANGLLAAIHVYNVG